MQRENEIIIGKVRVSMCVCVCVCFCSRERVRLFMWPFTPASMCTHELICNAILQRRHDESSDCDVVDGVCLALEIILSWNSIKCLLCTREHMHDEPGDPTRISRTRTHTNTHTHTLKTFLLGRASACRCVRLYRARDALICGVSVNVCIAACKIAPHTHKQLCMHAHTTRGAMHAQICTLPWGYVWLIC